MIKMHCLFFIWKKNFENHFEKPVICQMRSLMHKNFEDNDGIIGYIKKIT
jgi:hypothetical protein